MYRLDFHVSRKVVKITYMRGIYNPKLNIYTAHSVWAVYTLHVNDALRWMKRWLTLFMKPRSTCAPYSSRPTAKMETTSTRSTPPTAQPNTYKQYKQNCQLLPHWPAMPAYSLSPCARRNEICRQRRPADSLDELLGLATSFKERLEGVQ